MNNVRCLSVAFSNFLLRLFKSGHERNIYEWIQSHSDRHLFTYAEFIGAEAEDKLNTPDNIDATGIEVEVSPAYHGRA
jgi:hypothetical protein